MNYRTFNLEDWISHINEAIEDERELDGNEMRDLVAFLSKMPRWIAISERLPEEDTYVLVTTRWGEVTTAERYSENDWFIHEGVTNVETDEITAWMPLPKGYQAESEE